MTPTAPPSAPMPSPPRRRATDEGARGQRRDRPQRQVDAAPEEHGRDRGVEQPLGDVVGGERAERPRRQPTAAPSRHDAPVDPALARVAHGAGAAAAAEIAMFVPAAASRVAGDRDDERQPQRPEHEPEHRTQVAGDERAGESLARALQASTGARPAGVRQSGEDEEQVGEPVQIDQDLRVRSAPASRERRRARRGGRPCARREAAQRSRVPPGQDEALQLGQLAVEGVAEAPRGARSSVLDPQPAVALHGTDRSAPTSKSSFWTSSSGRARRRRRHRPGRRRWAS